jgi:hypothetical protein
MLQPRRHNPGELNVTETWLWNLIAELPTSDSREQFINEIANLLNTPILNHPAESIAASLAHTNGAANNRTFLLHAIAHDEQVALLFIDKLVAFGLLEPLWQADSEGVVHHFTMRRVARNHE